MPTAGFYNQNLYRDYPFRSQWDPPVELRSHSSESMMGSESYATAALPHSAIVDFGAIMGFNTGYDDRRDWVYLFSVSRIDPYILFSFRTTATHEVLKFAFLQTAPQYTYAWQESNWNSVPYEYPTIPSDSASVATHPSESEWWLHCFDPKWEGYLVIGEFDDLLDLLPNGQTLYFDTGYMVVEPSRIQNLYRGYVRSFNLANQARTTVLHDTFCYSGSSSISLGSDHQDVHAYIGDTCMQGDIILKEGYNCQIRQDSLRNIITITGELGGGAGPACEEFQLYPQESLGSGEIYYSGGPKCSQIFKSINGITASRIRITGGPGVNVRTDPKVPSKVIVDLTLEDYAVCLNPLGSEGGGG